MSISTTKEDLIQSSIAGIARGLCVHTLIFPLDVIKIRQQCDSSSRKSFEIARTLFEKEGVGAFYKGLSPQLVKTSIKQAWVWPILTGIPPYLKQYKIKETPSLLLTGFLISMIDAAITTPLEKSKIQSALAGKTKFSLKGGWQGFGTHLTNLSVNWSTFLIAQKHLRDRYRQKSEKALSLRELTEIGIQVAIIVSLVSAPIDFANTLKHAENRSPFDLLSGKALHRLYRGWPARALGLIIHNIASVIVIDKLSKDAHLQS